MHIIAEIASLVQYLKCIKEEPEALRPDRCPHCGKLGVWRHGCYPRKADRTNAGESSLNPIWIHRFFCPECHRTCSALPECIPPRRWYCWDVQQSAFLWLLAGKSLRTAARDVMPSRHTLTRWMARFQEQFAHHKDSLCHHCIELGRAVYFSNFWSKCLNLIPLSKAMRLCHASGVCVP